MDSAKGYIHKDLSKMIKAMRASIIYYWGIFSGRPQIQRNLCIFGAFIAGSEIQYCTMRPIVETGKNEPIVSFSAIFQTHCHWRNDLDGQFENICIDSSGAHRCDLNICECLPIMARQIKGKLNPTRKSSSLAFFVFY
jgi:hypothetical protein